jgi:subtilisin family serine protease
MSLPVRKRVLGCIAVLFLLTSIIPNALATNKLAEAKISPRLISDTANGRVAEALVVLTQQADLSTAASLPTKEAKGSFTLEALRSVANSSQASVIKFLKERGIAYESFYVVNAIKVTGTRDLFDELAARPDVATIDANPKVRTHLPTPSGMDSKGPENPNVPPKTIEWNVQRVNAPQAWFLGYKGQGRVVGSADTGVKWDHPALIVQYRGWNGQTVNHDYNWHDATTDQLTAPADPNSHGTFTTSEMVGDDGQGNQVGVAPGAQWIACRNMDRNGDGTPAEYIECFQWFLAPYPMGHPELADPKKAPDAINNSWDCTQAEGCTINTLLAAVTSVKAAGIFPVMAVGNSGPNCSTVSDPPEFYAASVSVGATDVYNNVPQYSSRGPVTVDNSGRLKPDLAAPGDNIRGAVPYNNGYQGYWSGTSMAAPEVTGAVAMIWQAKPALKGNVDATEGVLKLTATHLTSTQNCGGPGTVIPNNVYGYGLLNIVAAVGGISSGTGH